MKISQNFTFKQLPVTDRFVTCLLVQIEFQVKYLSFSFFLPVASFSLAYGNVINLLVIVLTQLNFFQYNKEICPLSLFLIAYVQHVLCHVTSDVTHLTLSQCPKMAVYIHIRGNFKKFIEAATMAWPRLRVKLLLLSDMNTHSIPVCLASNPAPFQCSGKIVLKWPKCVTVATHVGEQDRVQDPFFTQSQSRSCLPFGE